MNPERKRTKAASRFKPSRREDSKELLRGTKEPERKRLRTLREDDSGGDKVLHQVQPGLLFSKPKFGTFLTYKYKVELRINDLNERDEILEAVRSIINYTLSLNTTKQGTDDRIRTIVAFNPNKWSNQNSKLANLELRRKGGQLVPNSEKFLDTGGDVFFIVKSDVEGKIKDVSSYIKQKMGVFCELTDETKSSPPNKRIIQSSFQDGLANPCDAESLKSYIVRGEDSAAGYPGSTYLLAQKFEFNWTVIGNMGKDQQEDMIGRKTTDAIIPFTDSRAHIARAHVVYETPPMDAFKRHPHVFRFSMPYGKREPGKEEGLMYMSVSNSTKEFVAILKNIAGDQKHSALGEVTVDALISAVKPVLGSFWYVPSALELGLQAVKETSYELLEHWNVRSPSNQYLFYNQKEYLHRMTTGGYEPGDPPSRRALRLLNYAFLNWNDQWFKRRAIPSFPHLFDLPQDELPSVVQIQNASIMIRKGWAVKVSLGKYFTTNLHSKLEAEGEEAFFGRTTDTFCIHPDEIVVGQMPPDFSLGLGKVVMPYLREDEKMPAFVKGLGEAAGMGHVIPDYETLLRKGLRKIREELKAISTKTKEECDFLESCDLALEGVQMYIGNFGFLAGYLARERSFTFTSSQRENLVKIEARMVRIATFPPESFLEAVQLLYSYHCCLHLTGEPTSIGRLDQLLEPFLRGTPLEEAQEILDCLWIKLGGQVHINRRLLKDLSAWGMTAVPYSSTGMFPHGDTINQWVQQVTVGGCKANDNEIPEDACNDITIMCLKASRRLPLNAPCLSLRMHKAMPKKVLQEAAKPVLSGGAHPIFPHDDRLIRGLIEAGTEDLPVDLVTARNFACDGCYEPIFPGETQFSLAYVPLLQVLEMVINHGSTYLLAGPAYLEGTPQSFLTMHPDKINSFDKVKELFATHLRVQAEYHVYLTLINYGNIAEFCPSPLLSPVIHGCLETKRDIYNAGAKYTIIGVQFISFANTVDALYAIKKLCFDHDAAAISLPELVRCLQCDWGYHMKEPFHDELAGRVRGRHLSDWYKELRSRALDLPKFGTSEGAANQDVTSIAIWLAEQMTAVVKTVSRDSSDGQPLKELIQDLKKKYSIPGVPWDVLLPPGSGTFEGYVGWGLSCAASADGRRAGSPIASDLSAAPTPLDKPATPKKFDIYKSLKSWDHTAMKIGLSNGAEVDLKIEENFKEEVLVDFLENYADEKEIGGNILTITCANPETLSNAQTSPEKYDLIRVRTGGWTEFYVAFFIAHQKHQERRMYYFAP